MTTHTKNPTNALLVWISTINLCLMLALALWQIQRAIQKYELIDHKPQETITIDASSDIEQHHDNQPVHINIPVDKQHYFIIKPAIYHHRVGVELLATAKLPGQKKRIIVHLGWQENEINAKQSILAYDQQSGIDGVLYQPKGRLLTQVTTHQDWPKTLSYLDPKTIQDHLGVPILSKVVVTKGSALFEQLQQLQIVYLGIVRHICYALQFIALGVIGTLISLRLQRNHRRYAPTKK